MAGDRKATMAALVSGIGILGLVVVVVAVFSLLLSSRGGAGLASAPTSPPPPSPSATMPETATAPPAAPSATVTVVLRQTPAVAVATPAVVVSTPTTGMGPAVATAPALASVATATLTPVLLPPGGLPVPTLSARPSTPAHPDSVTFISATVVVATRGSGPGQVGLETLPGWGCMRAGPESFDVDEGGSIYLIDNRNYRVNKYDPAGKFVSSFGYGRDTAPIDIAISADGSVFLLDELNRRVLKYDAKGSLVATYDPGIGQGNDPYFVNVSSAGRVLMATLQFTELVIWDLGSAAEPVPAEEARSSAKRGSPGYQGAHVYRDGFARMRTAMTADGVFHQIDVTLADGRQVRLEVDLGRPILATGPLYTDRQGHVFLLVDTFLAPGTDRILGSIMQFDRQGKRLGVFDLPQTKAEACPHLRFRVDPAGRFYYLLGLMDEVRIIKWEAR